LSAAARAAATVVTHGCRANLAERDALAALAPAGSTVINSCAVTAEAVRDARAAVRRATGEVFLTGCAATLAPARFADLAVTILPNKAKLRPDAWGRPAAPALAAVSRASRAFVAIQDGCDHACTFCVTRLARGASRSVPFAELVARVSSLADSGINEVVLTGIDSTSYGADRPGTPGLGALVRALLAQVPNLPRLRLSSLDAAEADDTLLEAFAEPRLMPHVHLSLQSGDDLVLKRMKRRHSRADAVRLVGRLKAIRPDIAIGADLIAGFPTEGEAAHRRSLALLDDCDIVHAHIFPYSPRPGTPAARMPQLPPATIRARAAELREAASARKDRFLLSLLHKETETVSEGRAGITPQGAKLCYAAPAPRGALVRGTPVRVANSSLAA
jgi:threonylcarbamoyladenosine tRNA methylthiotransferase MtaB